MLVASPVSRKLEHLTGTGSKQASGFLRRWEMRSRSTSAGRSSSAEKLFDPITRLAMVPIIRIVRLVRRQTQYVAVG